MYQSFTTVLLPRSIVGSAIDIGAYEYANRLSVVDETFDYQVFPNPTTGLIYIKATGCSDNRVKIYNHFGQIMGATVVKNDAFDMSYLPTGIYLVELSSEFKTIQRRVVKL